MINKLLLFTLGAVAVPCALAQIPTINAAWLPVTDAELKLSSPVVDKTAGVEALFWRVHVLDELRGQDIQRVLYHYVRLKVFNQQGKDKLASIDIEYGDRTAIMYVNGRTVRADGSIVELGKDAVHSRVLVKAGGVKRKVRSFAMPGVDAGAIVEYRWKEVRDDPRIMYMRLQFQLEYPVQKTTYFIKPLSREVTEYRMGVWPFNCQPSPLKEERDGLNSTTLENVPAFEDEPMMPGEPNVRPWLLVMYRKDEGPRNPEKYWPSVGKRIYGELKSTLKSSDEMKQAVAKITEGATGDEDKVLRILRYLRSNVRNYFDSRVSDAERAQLAKKLEKLRSAPDVFKSGIGTPDELNSLFAELCTQAGLEARPAMVASRSDVFFDPKLAESYFLPNVDMAVKIGDQWRLFDVSSRFMPANMLIWQEEGQRALLADPKTPSFISAPISKPEDSVDGHIAKLALSADGTLEGDVEEFWTGHAASRRRRDFDGESEARQQEIVKEELIGINKQAEVSAIKVENAGDPEQPLRVKYHISVPGYAQRTGKRLLFQPVFFERASAPMFSAAERKYDIHFRHAWKETERVSITLPEGFELERADNPGGMDFGAPGSYTLQMGMDQRELLCVRGLVFGDKGMLIFPRSSYGQLKTAFDGVHARDTHILALKQSASGAR